MEFNQEDTNGYQGIVNENEKLIPIQTIENRNYLYPDGHRTTHQMRWLNCSRDRE